MTIDEIKTDLSAAVAPRAICVYCGTLERPPDVSNTCVNIHVTLNNGGAVGGTFPSGYKFDFGAIAALCAQCEDKGKGVCAVIDGAVEIPDGLFSRFLKNVSKIVEVSIPAGVAKIRQYCFKECTSLRRINLSEGLIEIEEDTFKDLKSLSSIDIPKSVTKIGCGAFNKCASLTSIK